MDENEYMQNIKQLEDGVDNTRKEKILKDVEIRKEHDETFYKGFFWTR